MRPTRFGVQGLVFWLAMVAAFFAAPYSNPFFLLLAFLTLLGAAGLLGAHRNLRGVRGSVELGEPVPAGGGEPLRVALHAPGRARHQLDVCLELEDGGVLAARIDLLRGDEALALDASGLPRGVHAVRRATVESAHPFGLVRLRRPLAATGELVVYPSPDRLLDGRGASEVRDELLGRGDPGAGDLQPAGLRDHRDGDGVRDVHWRASARRARLVVQEWEGGTGEGLEVVLDRRCPAERLELALATLSALVHLARAGKETLRLHTQGLSATFGEGHRPWPEVLRALAAAEPLPANGSPPPTAAPAVLRLPRPDGHA